MSTTKLECEWAYFLYCLDLKNLDFTENSSHTTRFISVLQKKEFILLRWILVSPKSEASIPP